MSKNILISILGALVLVFAGTTVYFMMINNLSGEKASVVNQQTIDGKKDVNTKYSQHRIKQNNISDWKSENINGINFKYPSQRYNLARVKSSPLIDGESVLRSRVSLHKISKNQANQQRIDIYVTSKPVASRHIVSDLNVNGFEKVVVNKKKMYKYQILGMGDIEGYVIKHGDKYYTFEAMFTDDEIKKDLNGIVGSINW